MLNTTCGDVYTHLGYVMVVGFTGTPIDATLDVFGEVIDSYTMTESVPDLKACRWSYNAWRLRSFLQEVLCPIGRAL